MWLWTRQEAKEIDQLSIQSGIAEEKLMETAGQKSAAEILLKYPDARTALIFCGPGHNGGDGFVVARELAKKISVTVIESGSPQSSELRSRKKSEYKGPLVSIEEFIKNPKSADLWIDALFGIGLSRPLDQTYQELIFRANQSPGAKVALDTPTGLDVDTGNIFGACFRAHLTLTVGHAKPGFFLNHGPEHCGAIRCLEIGFPKEISQKVANEVFLLSSKLAHRWIPKRSPMDNKTKGGRTLIWAGSSEMPGAAILACRAASRVGAGYVYCSEPEVLKASPESIPWRQGDFSKIDSVLIGPGLGTGSQTAEFIENLKKTSLPVVIDADALSVAAREKLYPFPAHWIATPHAGELSRFLKASAREIEEDRISFCRQAQKTLGCTVLLKGFHTVVTFSQFSVIVPTGNVALAKGGSGDVLGGMIAGFLSQKISADRASLLAAFLHGKMADEWLQSGRDLLSLTPSDLIQCLPFSLHRLRSLKTTASP